MSTALTRWATERRVRNCRFPTFLATCAGGLQRCQVVRNADVDAVRQWVAIYRECRTALRQIEAIQKQQKALLHGVMEKRNLPYK